MSFDEITHRRYHKQFFMWKFSQRFSKHTALFFEADVFVDDAMHARFDQTKAAFYRYAARAKALFGYGDIEFLRQIFQFLVYLLWIHDIVPRLLQLSKAYTLRIIHSSFVLENKVACVIFQDA